MRVTATLKLTVPLILLGFAAILSTVNLFATRLGSEAAALLGRYIRTGRVPASKVLPSALVVRESTGPVRSRGPRA